MNQDIREKNSDRKKKTKKANSDLRHVRTDIRSMMSEERLNSFMTDANHRQMSLTGTDHCNSKLSKLIQFEKKQSLKFLIFEKICKIIIKKGHY